MSYERFWAYRIMCSLWERFDWIMRVVRKYDYIKTGVAVVGYNSNKEIFRCLKDFIGHVDAVIPGDGKYEFYPGTHDYSTDGWIQTVEDMFKGKAEVHSYKLAGKQIDKRQKYLDIAGEIGLDFLICIDTDDYIDPAYQDWDLFYNKLINISDALDDRVFYKWVWVPDEKTWSKQGNQFPSNTWRKSTRVHKDPGTMRYCMENHFTWCAKDVDDQTLIKWQLENREEENPYQFVPRIVIEGVRDRLDRTLRTPEQVKAGAEWAHMNQHAENSRQFYLVSQAMETPPPPGCKSWDEWAKLPHTFDKNTGQRINLH